MPSLRTVVLLAFCLMAIQSYARQKPAPKPKATVKNEDVEKVFEKIEINATTNPQQWEQHLKKRTVLPDSVLQKIPAGEYTAIVQFVVDKYGNVGDIELKTDPGYGLGRVALNVIRSYKGEWKPAIQCGRAVKAYKKQPVKFVVAE